MPKDQSRQNKKGLRIVVCNENLPDSGERRRRVIDILMKAATRSAAASRKNTIAEEEKTPRHAPSKKGLAGSGEDPPYRRPEP